jgi:hypothetical protein
LDKENQSLAMRIGGLLGSIRLELSKVAGSHPAPPRPEPPAHADQRGLSHVVFSVAVGMSNLHRTDFPVGASWFRADIPKGILTNANTELDYLDALPFPRADLIANRALLRRTDKDGPADPLIDVSYTRGLNNPEQITKRNSLTTCGHRQKPSECSPPLAEHYAYKDLVRESDFTDLNKLCIALHPGDAAR